MPYVVKDKCVYRKDTGKRVGCTKGSVKAYLKALHANAEDEEVIDSFTKLYNRLITYKRK